MKQDHAPAASAPSAAPADPEAAPVIGPATGRRRRRASTLWQLWDAGDLVSCHASKADAIAARADLLACHLAEFPRDRHYLEDALMIEPDTRSAAEGDNDGPGPKPGRVQVWALWDAADLAALHATEPGARNALRAHLIRNTEEDPAAQALLERSVHITPITLHQP